MFFTTTQEVVNIFATKKLKQFSLQDLEILSRVDIYSDPLHLSLLSMYEGHTDFYTLKVLDWELNKSKNNFSIITFTSLAI